MCELIGEWWAASLFFVRVLDGDSFLYIAVGRVLYNAVGRALERLRRGSLRILLAPSKLGTTWYQVLNSIRS